MANSIKYKSIISRFLQCNSLWENILNKETIAEGNLPLLANWGMHLSLHPRIQIKEEEEGDRDMEQA